jgi:ribulose-5-phosphate 4-epimerase/fuculose-1-phosphate aldolase
VRIATALGKNKAAVLRNHGLLTTGGSVESAAWFYVSMERNCQVELAALAAAGGANGQPLREVPEAARVQAYSVVGTEYAGWFQFQLLYARALKENPDFLD